MQITKLRLLVVKIIPSLPGICKIIFIFFNKFLLPVPQEQEIDIPSSSPMCYTETGIAQGEGDEYKMEFSPTFEFTLHLLISTIVIGYYGLAAFRHLSERCRKTAYTQKWPTLGKAFALYYILGESYFLYEHVVHQTILLPEIAIALQVIGLLVILIACVVFLTDGPEKTAKKGLKKKR